jgi:flavin-dependent dehydrogenase
VVGAVDRTGPDREGGVVRRGPIGRDDPGGRQMTTTSHHDVVVVGARVAGAATAMLLARAGLRVLVVDQAREGSDTMSTHAFMRAGVIQLSRFGVLDELRAGGTPPIRRTVIRYGETEEVVPIKPVAHCDALYAPRRTTLDPLLVAAARRAGAEVRFGVRVTALLRDADGRVAGVAAHERDGRELELRARWTVGADGLGSRVAQEVGAGVVAQGSHATAFIGGYVGGLEVDGYQWLYGERVTGGIIPTDDGAANVWAGVPSTDFPRLRGRPDHGFHEVMAAVAPDWHERILGAERRGPFRAWPGTPGVLRQAWGAGWALVGDAGSFKDPLSTHGMTDALRDAELLADALLAALDAVGPQAEAAALRGYQELRDELSLDLFTRVDRLASFDWHLDDLRPLLIGVSQAMRAEVDHLLARDLVVAA